MSRFLRLCAVLAAMFISVNAFAAGYTCERQILSCGARYYFEKELGRCAPCTGGSTSEPGATDATQCYWEIPINKNGFSIDLAAGAGTGCKIVADSTGTDNATLRVYAKTECTLPTFTAVTQSGIRSTGWSTSNALGGATITKIAASLTAPSFFTIYAQKTQCAAGYYKNGTACAQCSALGIAYASSEPNLGDSSACFATCTAGSRVQSPGGACIVGGSGAWLTTQHAVRYGAVSPLYMPPYPFVTFAGNTTQGNATSRNQHTLVVGGVSQIQTNVYKGTFPGGHYLNGNITAAYNNGLTISKIRIINSASSNKIAYLGNIQAVRVGMQQSTSGSSLGIFAPGSNPLSARDVTVVTGTSVTGLGQERDTSSATYAELIPGNYIEYTLPSVTPLSFIQVELAKNTNNSGSTTIEVQVFHRDTNQWLSITGNQEALSANPNDFLDNFPVKVTGYNAFTDTNTNAVTRIYPVAGPIPCGVGSFKAPTTNATWSNAALTACASCASTYGSIYNSTGTESADGTVTTTKVATANSQCYASVPGGKYIAAAGDSALTECPAGYYCLSAMVKYGAASNAPTICPAGSMCPAASRGHTQCSRGFYQPDQGQATCIAAPENTYVDRTGSTSYTECSSLGNGLYNSTLGRTGANTPSSCKIVCASGETVERVGAACTAIPDGAFAQVTGPIGYGETKPSTYCNTLGAINYDGSQITYSSVAPRDTYATCRAVANVPELDGCSSVTANTLQFNGTKWDSELFTVLAAAGHYVSSTDASNPSCTACATGSYQPDSDSTATSCILTDPGHYASRTGSTAQTPCPLGQYMPEQGAWICYSCGRLAGSSNYSDTDSTGSTSESQCFGITTAGYYVESTSNGQKKCPAGSYCPGGTKVYHSGTDHPTTGGIETCPSGSYCPAESSAPTTCASSTNDLYNLTESTGSESVDQCYLLTSPTKRVEAANAGEVSCPAGHYCAGNIKVFYGTLGGSELCPSGSYCPAEASEPTACPDGYTKTFYDESSDDIVTLPSTTFVTQNGAKSIDYCHQELPYGKYVDSARVAQECPAGFYCGIKQDGYKRYIKYGSVGGFTRCPAGTFQPYTGAMAPGTGLTCTDVKALGVLSQTVWNGLCSTYEIKEGCFVVQIGHEANASSGATTQTKCEIGEYQPNSGQVSCLKCADLSDTNGFYNQTTSTGSSNYTACYGTLSPGSYVPIAKRGHAPCPAGSYCPGGEEIAYMDLSGSPSARPTTGGHKSCPAGSYCNAAVSAPTPCPDGYQITTTPTGNIIETTKYTTEKGLPNAQSSEYCHAEMPYGTYVASAGAAIAECPKGSYCGVKKSGYTRYISYGQTSTPTQCPSGSYTSWTGAMAPGEGLTCADAQPRGLSNYSWVNDLCVSHELNGGCVVVAAGTHTNATIGATSEVLCEIGTYQPNTGTTSCIRCDSLAGAGGFYNQTDARASKAATKCYGTTSPAKYVSTANKTETDCPAGFFCAGDIKVYYGETGGSEECGYGNYCPADSSAPTACPTFSENTEEGYTYTLNPTAAEITITPSNKDAFTKQATSINYCYANVDFGEYIELAGATPVTCPAGSYCGTKQSNDDMRFIQYGTTGGKTLCPTGTFQKYSGAYASSGTCSATKPGSATQSEWDEMCSTHTVTNGCLVVPAGYYANKENGATKTTPCAAGTYQPSAGQTSCLVADAGYYVPETGMTSQTACTGSTYQELTGQSSCTQCPAPETLPDGVEVKSHGYWISGDIHTARSGCNVYYKPITLDNGTLGSSYCYIDEPTDANAPVTYGLTGTSKNGCYIRRENLSCDAGYYNNFFTYSPDAMQNNTGKTLSTVTASACTPVGAGYWSEPDTITRNDCPKGYSSGSETAASEDMCAYKTSAGKYIASIGASSLSSCPAGYYCPGNILVYYGSTGGNEACPTGYVNGSSGQSSQSKCAINCPGGEYISEAGAPSCTPVGAGYYAPQTNVYYGQTSKRIACPSRLNTIGYGTGADEVEDCGPVLRTPDGIVAFLRAAQTTTPSLRALFNGTTYYGALSRDPGITSASGLKIMDNDTKYRVWNSETEMKSHLANQTTGVLPDGTRYNTREITQNYSAGGTGAAASWSAIFSYGRINGLAYCSTTAGDTKTYATKFDISSSSSGTNCWCAITSGRKTSTWFPNSTFKDAASCANECAASCAGEFSTNSKMQNLYYMRNRLYQSFGY